MHDPKTNPATQTSADNAMSKSDTGRSDPAASATATWQAIDVALRPILGSRGVEALYWRALHLAALAHPWLANRSEKAEETMDLKALASVLDGQAADDAEAGSRALLDQFRQLLESLVGASLTARLLASVPSMRADTTNSQDTPP